MAVVKTPVLKVILCGEYGVGKSSIFRRFINNTFVPTVDRRATLGLDHFDKVYHVGDKDVKVRVCFLNLFNLHHGSLFSTASLLNFISFSVATMGHRWYGEDRLCYIKLLQVC